jgi:15-cis-phytoene synthase
MNDGQGIALAYAPPKMRDAVAALWALDAALGRVVATTSEPMIGQMRLTWWHERLSDLDSGLVPEEPVLTDLTSLVRDHDVTGSQLAALVEGWEVLLEPLPLGEACLREFSEKRGETLFTLSAQILGLPVSAGLGAGWALMDFAMHCSDVTTRKRAQALFKPMPIKGPKSLRILARIARLKAMQSLDEVVMPVSRWTMLRAVLS